MPLPSASRPHRPLHTASYDDTPSKIPIPIYSTPSLISAAARGQGSLRRAASKSLGNLAARAQAEAAAEAAYANSAIVPSAAEATPAKQVLRGHRGRSSISSPNELKKEYAQAYSSNWTEDVSMRSPALSIASPFVPLGAGPAGIRRKSIGLTRGTSAGSVVGAGMRPSGSASSQESMSTGESGSSIHAQAILSLAQGSSSSSSSSSCAGGFTTCQLPTPAKWSLEDPDLPSPFLRRMPTAPPAVPATRDRLPLGAINPQSTAGTGGTTSAERGVKKAQPMLIPRSKSGTLHQHVLKQNATATATATATQAERRVQGEGRVQPRQALGR